MNMNDIERALRQLRLSGIHATLEARVMQAQASQEPFLETFWAILQDELDRRRTRLNERRFKQSRLDERLTLQDFDWRFNPKGIRLGYTAIDNDHSPLLGGLLLPHARGAASAEVDRTAAPA